MGEAEVALFILHVWFGTGEVHPRVCAATDTWFRRSRELRGSSVESNVIKRHDKEQFSVFYNNRLKNE